MKPLKLGFFAFLLLSFSFRDNNDCLEQSQSECITKMPGGFNFLKGYPVVFNEKEYIEYSYVFTKGTGYFIGLCKSGTGQTPRFEVYDSNRNRVINVNSQDNSGINRIQYSCGATGIYYIRIYSSIPDFCGNCILAFSRKQH